MAEIVHNHISEPKTCPENKTENSPSWEWFLRNLTSHDCYSQKEDK